jgi:hypothetical protein
MILRRLAIVVALFVSACGGSSSPATPPSLSWPPCISAWMSAPATHSAPSWCPLMARSSGPSCLAAPASRRKSRWAPTHAIAGIANALDLLHHTTWTPATVNVPAAGFNYTMYCTTSLGYSLTPINKQ